MRYYIHLLIFVLIVCTTSCQTDIELCEQPVHPHLTKVTMNYDFSSYPYSHPDTVLILAERVINVKKYEMQEDVKSGLGSFLLGAPDLFADSLDQAHPDSLSSFQMSSGTYKLLTFSKNDKIFDYSNLDSIGNVEHSRWNFNSLGLNYRAYPATSDSVKKILGTWKDYNAYTDYVLTTPEMMAYDTLEIVKFHEGNNQLTFHPSPVTQHVMLSFDIRKVAASNAGALSFRIDSVKVDLAGVPAAYQLYTGWMDTHKTYKIASVMQMDGTDDFGTGDIHCSTAFDVTGIISGSQADIPSGPGILQVILYTTVRKDGQESLHRVQGKINLYHTLRDSGLLEYSDDESKVRQLAKSGTLAIATPLEIDGENILKVGSDDWGIDYWVPEGSEVIVEL